MMMKSNVITHSSKYLIILLVIVSGAIEATSLTFQCEPQSRCYGFNMTCPDECPTPHSAGPTGKVCTYNCDIRFCWQPWCTSAKPNCDSPGSACQDPRFIGADGIVFYFHGKSNEHFSLVSDSSLQINGRFIGHRPAGRRREFTWIQALGVLFKSHKFTLEATKAATWNSEVDHLKFSYNGENIIVPEGALSRWYSPEKDVKVERIAEKNTVIVSLKGSVEIMVNVVPVTKEDDRIHKYSLPANDCFAHLEVQFKFFSLSPMVDGVLGRTYRPDFDNPAKPGVAMPVLGGDDKYRTTSLVSADCSTCLFGSKSNHYQETPSATEYAALNCAASPGHGIVCKR
ncbi:Root cap [Corchorus capsularis]|uniref:Root cap n=1 Tax=Corchorus capsularis TaxID=210143 RepID=A0A1R3ICX3_COCAP|nr:Root cap [Corchorus capsularis]